jgi:bifunctional DNase/RNase
LRVARRLRARGARGPLAGGALADEAAPDPADDAERRADAQRVWAAVAALPEGQRDAVVLHYLAGLSQAEVAAHLQTAEGAIRNRLYKARAALREQLTESPQEVPVVSDHVPVRIASIGRSEEERWSATHVVVLEETRGARRRLPIWIDTAEATALAAALESVELPRPGTYMLTSALLQAVGRAVREVRIERLDADIFYAVVVLDDGASVDARPSDALNLAVVAGAPITVAETVLEAADEPVPALSEDTAAIAETVRRRLMRAT